MVKSILHEFAGSLGAAVDAKDTHTRQHSEEVAAIAYVLALDMGINPAQADIIHVAAHLHDVGKIGIPDTILKKTGPLSNEEWQIMRQHPAMGVEIIRPVRALRESGVVEMILYHHERFDGKGYPHGLQGDEIPLGARIITLADTISAMMQKRPYREASSFEAVRMEVSKHSGTQFDPRVVESFFSSQVSIRQMILSTQSNAGALHSMTVLETPDVQELSPCLKTGTDDAPQSMK